MTAGTVVGGVYHKAMSSPEYLMWFSRFGTPHLETQDRLDDCYELKHMLRNADTETFDMYGVLDRVERVGHGVIPPDEWESGLEEYVRQTGPDLTRSANDGTGEIRISPPPGVLPKVWETYRTYTDHGQIQADYQWLCETLGVDRVVIEWQ